MAKKKNNSALRYYKARLIFLITNSIYSCKDPFVYIMSYHREKTPFTSDSYSVEVVYCPLKDLLPR